MTTDHQHTTYVRSIGPDLMQQRIAYLNEFGFAAPIHLYMVLGKARVPDASGFHGEFEGFALGGFPWRAKHAVFPDDFENFLRLQFDYLGPRETNLHHLTADCFELAVVVFALPDPIRLATRIHHLRYVEPTNAAIE